MLVKVNVVLKNLAGEPLKDADSNGEVVDATLKMAIANSLLTPVRNKEDSGVEKIKKYELARKVYANDEVDLDENDIKLIKDCVNAVFPPLICGQVNEMLRV